MRELRRFLVPVVALAWPMAIAWTVAVAPPAHAQSPDTPRLDLDTGSATLESGADPGFPVGGLLGQFCWPPLRGTQGTTGRLEVAVDGALTGACGSSKEDSGMRDNIASTLTGQWDKSNGTVTFHVDGKRTMVMPITGGTATTDSAISFDATDVPVAGGQATGRARFTFSCVSTTPGASTCGPPKVTGTIGFTLVLGAVEEPPETAPTRVVPIPGGGDSAQAPTSAGEAPPGVPPAGTASDGSNGGGIPPVAVAAIAAVALGVIGAGALAVHRSRRRTRAAELANPPSDQLAAVTADRLGGFEDSPSYADGAGKAIPGVSRAYESLVIQQAPYATKRSEVLAEPTGSTTDDLREQGVVRDAARARGGNAFDHALEKLRKPPRR